ncbi:hypothetical protein D6T65_15115 [Arthrobacter frigidicola]|nr:hypothetical protein D6T65_15115 [Arthrobacter frigidicola]
MKVDSSYIIPVYEDPQFDGDDFIQIELKNQGDKSVTVTNYAVEMGERGFGSNMWVTRPPVWATRLPATAEPGGVPVKLLVPVPELRELRRASGIPFDKMHPWVELGDGRKVYSTNTVPMKD